MSGPKKTVAPKKAVKAVVVPGTPQAEQDATLDESRRSLPVADATERPVFGPLNRTAPAATENVVAAEDSANSTPAGTPSKSDADDRSKSSRSSGEASSRAESSTNESRRSLPAVCSGEVSVRANGASLNGSSADIPFDSTGDLAEMTGSASNSLPPQETSTDVEIRELRKAAKETPKQKPFTYPRLELDEDGSPLKPINESSEPSGRSETLKTPQWHQEQAYRSLSAEKTPEASPSSTNHAETASPNPAIAAANVSVNSVPSASNGSSLLSSPPASPSETSAKVAADSSVATLPSASSGRLESTISSPPASLNASAEAAAPVADASSVATLPSASTGGASTLSTPPATPETSAQAAVRTIHEELRGITPSKLLRVDRDYMSLDNTPLSIVAERTEPSYDSANIDELTWNRALAYRSSSEEPMDTSGPKPKPKATKRRVPHDADINDTPPARRIAQAHRSRRSTASSVSSGPCCSKDVPRSRRHCPTCRCDDTMFPPIDEVNDALSDFNGYFEEDAPAAAAASDVESVAPALDDLSSDELSSEEDPLADMLSDDEVPAEPPVPACPRCGRNCTCVPVEIPEEVVPPRRRAPRRQPKMSLEDAWKALKFIDDFEMTDLPAAPPKYDEDFDLLEGRPLTKDRIKKYGFTDDFQVALYEDGEVVFQGSFPGVRATTELLRRAIYQPVLAYHVPEDPVKDIEVGDDFFVMITEAGHFLSLGANDEGQLGASAFPSRYRQRAVTPATMRRFPVQVEGQVGDIVFTDIAVVGKTVFATDEEGRTFMCGEGFDPLLTLEEDEEEE